MATHAATALQHHLDLLLAALFCGGLLSGVLLTAAALALLLILAVALLAVAALAASDVCRLSVPAARAVDAAAADLRLARAVAFYVVLGAVVRASVALRAWAGVLASRAGYAKNLMLRTAQRFTVVVGW